MDLEKKSRKEKTVSKFDLPSIFSLNLSLYLTIDYFINIQDIFNILNAYSGFLFKTYLVQFECFISKHMLNDFIKYQDILKFKRVMFIDVTFPKITHINNIKEQIIISSCIVNTLHLNAKKIILRRLNIKTNGELFRIVCCNSVCSLHIYNCLLSIL